MIKNNNINNFMQNKFGFDLIENLKDIEKKKEDDFTLGAKKSLSFEILQPDGQWGEEYMPDKEYQRKNGLETMNCTVYGSLIAYKGIDIKKYGRKKANKIWSPRFIGILAGTTKNGNLIRKPLEAIRGNGMINYEVLPFDNTIKTWGQYYNPKPMTKELLNLGKEFFNEYELPEHEWVYNSGLSLAQKQEKLQYALKGSLLGVSVFAWRKNKKTGLYYKKSTDRDNHLCVLRGFVIGKFWRIFDTYDNVYKNLEWNYNFTLSKRYNLTKINKKSMFKLVKVKDNSAIYFIDTDNNKHLFKNKGAFVSYMGNNAWKLVETISEDQLFMYKDGINYDIRKQYIFDFLKKIFK